jgi:glycolate oxidase FAD binding subunit
MLEELLGERIGRLSDWGGPDVPIASPRDVPELVAVLAHARAAGARVLPIGNGTKLDWALVPERVDLALSTRRLTGVVAHDPAEGVVTARAGTTMRDLARHVAAGGLRLVPDVARAERSTLGGVIGAAQSGGDRMRSGPLRDHVLGVGVVLADGRLVRSGGALVKDVAGYDLHRLVCGAHGLLGVVVEASLRLEPQPAERVLVRTRVPDLERGVQAAFEVEARCPGARAVRLDGTPEEVWLAVELDGEGEVTEDLLARALGVLGQAHVLRGDAARRVSEELREREYEGGRWSQVELDTLPSQVAAAAHELVAIAGPRGQRLEVHPRAGIVHVAFEPGPTPDQAAAVEALAARRRANLRWRGLPPQLRRELSATRARPSGLDVMRRLREALDPTGLFAGPRLHPLL